MLPGNVCVSFSNSPVTAERDFKVFVARYPNGAGYANVVSFFEQSSAKTGNDYLIAFSDNPRIVKITDGKRVQSIAKTAWIGDKAAYERFREYELRERLNIEHGRAMNAVIFADELKDLPASDLYSAMRGVVADRSVSTVGGFVSVISNRDGGFRFSVYSDMLYDWPNEKPDDYKINNVDPITLTSSQENLRYSVAQMSPEYLSLNIVAFYFAKGKTLFVFYGEIDNKYYGLPCRCRVINGVEAGELEGELRKAIDVKWLLLVTSGVSGSDAPRKPGEGVKLGFFVEANTFPMPTETSTPAAYDEPRPHR